MWHIMQDLFDNVVTGWVIDNLPTVLVSLATFAGGIVSALIIVRKRKNRLWYWASVSPVMEASWDDKIKIYVDENQEPDVYMCVCGLRYQGEDLIKADAHDNPVTFKFTRAKVLAAEAFESNPRGIPATVFAKNDHVAELNPIGLNDGDQIAARILLTEQESPKVEGHIIGIKGDIRNEDQRRWWQRFLWFLIPAPVLVGVTIVLVILESQQGGDKSAPIWATSLVTVSGGIMILSMAMDLRRERRLSQRPGSTIVRR